MNLPNKLSDLIELSLKCLIKCEQRVGYKIFMPAWHDPNTTNHCLVCLAGSVMAVELAADKNYSYHPKHFQGEELALWALEQVRLGNVGKAIWYLEGNPISGVRIDKFNREIPHYDINPSKFKRQLRKLARDLRNSGL